MKYITQEILDRIAIKKDLMRLYNCKTYYELKILLGKDLIESIVQDKITQPPDILLPDG